MYLLERTGTSAFGNIKSSVKVNTLNEVAKYLSISINTFFLLDEVCREEGARTTDLKFYKNSYIFKFIGWDEEDELEEEHSCKRDMKTLENLINKISVKYRIGATFKFTKQTKE